MLSSKNPFWLRFTPQFFRKRLVGRSRLHTIIHNTGWLLGDKALRLGLGLFVGAWVARYLGPSKYGELSYVLAFVAFFQVIGKLGIDNIAIRDIACDRNASATILGTVFRLRLISGIFSWLVAIGSMALLRPGDSETLVLTAIVASTVVFQAADTIDLWFQSQTQSKRTVSAKAIAYVINSLLKVGLILLGAPLIFFAITSLIEFLLSAVALYFSYRLYPAPFRWGWDIERGKLLLKESWSYMLSGLAIIVYMRTDQIMLREMLGAEALGTYSAALPLSTTWYFIPMMISQSVGPAIAQKRESDKVVYNRLINQLFSLSWWLMLPLSISIALASDPLIRILYGTAYSASANILAVHVFANIPVALGVMQTIWIVNERKNIIFFNKAIVGAISNVVMNIFMIPLYGAFGAALATVFSQLVSAVFSNILFAPNIFKRQFAGLIKY